MIRPIRLSIRSFSITTKLKSSYTHVPRKTISDIHELYKSNIPITISTSHDYITSKMVDDADIDINLVGDSLANTTLGYQDTNELTIDEMLYHVKSVQRGNSKSLIVADLPFGSFEKSQKQAIESAIKLIQLGKIQAVKLEGANEDTLKTIKKLVSIGVPVMGHSGLTPQKHNTMGGYKIQGKDSENALQIYKDCLNLQKSGVFAIVLECIPNKISKFITEKLNIPTIGIGAGPYCSGQVLVISDLLGMKNPEENHIAKFVKPYANFYNLGIEGLKNYKNDVITKKFPLADEHGYKIKKEVYEQFKKEAESI
ncbi:ECM31 [Candida pseudojiufengensis]|uniref:ECM31 n=1 Tax=Candida pseudojiufengensis TaxID=497109 RepID=UPI002224C697|nr:ECM31 [Candida pseudojiufengensis]KAI5966508.1 ECM31 [Candida pseudojiufengensis]